MKNSGTYLVLYSTLSINFGKLQDLEDLPLESKGDEEMIIIQEVVGA